MLGPVDGVDYCGPYFRPREIIDGLAKAIVERTRSGQRVVLIGSSMGAMMIVFVLREAYRQGVEIGVISAVLIDPPSGAESLKSLPNITAPLVARMGRLPQWVNKGVLNSLFQKQFCHGIADDAPIEVPAERHADAETYHEEVRMRCFIGQQGFAPTLAIGELAWMARVGRDGSLAAACDFIDGDFSITHVACTGDNEVVENPLAQEFYKKHLPSARFFENPTNHTNYEQAAPSWRKFLVSRRVLVD